MVEHSYRAVYEALTPEQIAAIIWGIEHSERFEMGELSHVKVRGLQGRIVGYLGDESVEFVDPKDNSIRDAHISFLEVCNAALESIAETPAS